MIQVFRTAILTLIFCVATMLSAQTGKYKYHTVIQGETLFSISQNYEITVQEILDLNPEVDEKISVGATLLIPFKEKGAVQNDPENAYRVKSGDTWYSISRRLECSVSQLQSENREAYEQGPLQIGQLLNIPFAKKEEKKEPKTEPLQIATKQDSTSKGITYHHVNSGETWYSIARAYGSKPSKLLNFNSDLNGKLNAGDWVIVKKDKSAITETSSIEANKEAKDSAEIKSMEGTTAVMPVIDAAKEQSSKGKDEAWSSEEEISANKTSVDADTNEQVSYVLYRIKKDDTLESMAKEHYTTIETLLKLNPELEDGLLQGRYIIVPEISEEYKLRIDSEEVENEETGVREFKLSVLLPFGADGGDSLTVMQLGEARNARMRLRASSFYGGMQLALDSLMKGVDSLGVKVFDTANELATIDTIRQDPFFQSSTMILGPLYGKNAIYLDKKLGESSSAFQFSPLSSNLPESHSANLVNLYPDGQANTIRIAQWITQLGDSVIWTAAGSGNAEERKWLEEIRNAIPDSSKLKYSGRFLTPDEEKGFFISDMKSTLSDGYLMVIVNLSKAPSHIADLEQKAYSLGDSIMLVSIHEWPNRLQQQFKYLNKLRVAFPKAFHVNYEDTAVKIFVKKYRETYQAEPDIFSFQAWDCIFMMAKMWEDNFAKDTYEHKGLQTSFYMTRENGFWINMGSGLIYMNDYKWLRGD